MTHCPPFADQFLFFQPDPVNVVETVPQVAINVVLGDTGILTESVSLTLTTSQGSATGQYLAAFFPILWTPFCGEKPTCT